MPPAKKYRSLQTSVFLISLILNLFFLGFFFLSGFSVCLKKQAHSLFSHIFLANGLYLLVFYAVFYFLNLPLSLYEGFILEHQFQLSRQTFFNWLKDNLKKAALELILLLVVAGGVYFFLGRNQNYWWIFAGIFWLFLTLLLAKITPTVIVPLFYKYLPITNAELKKRIFSLFERCKIKIKDASSINFSQKTKKANAFVSGLGKNKKVVLSDTLLENFSFEEIEGVLAHELGHYLGHDILKLIIVNSGFTFLGFYITDRLLKKLLAVSGLSAIDDIAFLPVMALCLMLLGLVMLPVQNSFSRYLEKKADLFSLRLTRNKDAFIAAMQKLGKINLADLSPSRFIEIWLYDHPPIAKRIKLAEEFKC